MASSRQHRAIFVQWHMPDNLDAQITCEREHMNIVDEPDMFLRVFESDDGHFPTEINGEWQVSSIMTFGVTKAILQESKSSYFSTFCRTNNYSIKRKELQDLAGPNVKAMEIWLRTMHDTMTHECYEVGIEEIWHLMVIAHYYGLKERDMAPFFECWYHSALAKLSQPLAGEDSNQETLSFNQKAITPAYRFFAVRSFAHITHYLTYHSAKHVTDTPAIDHYHLHMPPRILQQVNAARGHLRNLVSKTLNNPIRRLVKRQPCKCSPMTVLKYLGALSSASLWPVDEIWRDTSAASAIKRLAAFRFQPPANSCTFCTRPQYEYKVRKRARHIENTFDGLCLNCMEGSQPKTENKNHDYWLRNTMDSGLWNEGCGFPHGESTFYYSFNGQVEERTWLIDRKKSRRGNYYDSDSSF